MRAQTCIVALVATLPLFGAACPEDPVASCEAIQRAQCEFAFRCCDAEERLGPEAPVSVTDYVSSESECSERASGVCKYLASSNRDAIALGRMRFDSEAARSCLAGLIAARDQCDYRLARQVQGGPGMPCARALGVGAVEPGDACARNSECRLGGTCEVDAANPQVDAELGAVEGACSELGDEGDECGERACGTGLFCREGECAPLPGAGEGCASGTLCAVGHFCDAGECSAPRDAGEACTMPMQCLSGACEDGECQDPEVCTGS